MATNQASYQTRPNPENEPKKLHREVELMLLAIVIACALSCVGCRILQPVREDRTTVVRYGAPGRVVKGKVTYLPLDQSGNLTEVPVTVDAAGMAILGNEDLQEMLRLLEECE